VVAQAVTSRRASLRAHIRAARPAIAVALSVAAVVLGGLDDVRRIVADLHPAGLEDAGPVTALRRHADTLSRRTGGTLKIDVMTAGDLPSLAPVVEAAAYRIVLEALTNVARHARARTCVVGLGADADHLRLAVRDDGVGVEPYVPAGIGLRSMAERAAELGGTCQVRRRPGGGTLVEATLRLEG
jgi:signal transduction histidine kinase